MKKIFLVCSAFLFIAKGQDAAEILRRSVKLDAADTERLKDYTYIQRVETKAYHGKKVEESETEVREVTMLAGEQYERLIEKDGKPLSEKEKQKEQGKMDREFAKRQHISASEKAKQEKDRAEERKFLGELPDAFNLRIEGTEEISGKPAWIISAEPRAGFKPKTSGAKTLTKVRGKVWVDQAEFQWVKAEIEVLDTISMGLAMVRIAPGMTLNFEQTRVNDEVWLPSHFAMHGDARVALLLKMHGDVEVTYSDYKKFQTDSRIVPDEEKPSDAAPK